MSEASIPVSLFRRRGLSISGAIRAAAGAQSELDERRRAIDRFEAMKRLAKLAFTETPYTLDATFVFDADQVTLDVSYNERWGSATEPQITGTR